MNFKDLLGKITATKFRYLFAMLLGASCYGIMILLFNIEMPDKNRDAAMIVIGVFCSGLSASIQHIMKTTEKEKVNGTN
ncbi:MAG: hypothetical protein RLZZ196_969 [Bacteroidota bacterium]|jgi:hypothetical protein